MASTTNYSWSTPDDTALVKDGAAAIRSLGTAIDSTVFTNAGAAIAKTIVDAKGDIIAATAADTVSRLAVGANNTVLTADSSTGTGLKWAVPSAAGASWSLINAGGTNLTGATTITVSGIADADKLMVLIAGGSASANSTFTVRFNADSGTNYPQMGNLTIAGSTYAATNFDVVNFFTGNYIEFGKMSANGSSAVSGYVLLSGGNAAGFKAFNFSSGGTAATSNTHRQYNGGGIWANTATITSVSIESDAGNFDAGKIYVYKSL